VLSFKKKQCPILALKRGLHFADGMSYHAVSVGNQPNCPIKGREISDSQRLSFYIFLSKKTILKPTDRAAKPDVLWLMSKL